MNEQYLKDLITRLAAALEKAQWPGDEPEDTALIKEAQDAVKK